MSKKIKYLIKYVMIIFDQYIFKHSTSSDCSHKKSSIENKNIIHLLCCLFNPKCNIICFIRRMSYD